MREGKEKGRYSGFGAASSSPFSSVLSLTFSTCLFFSLQVLARMDAEKEGERDSSSRTPLPVCSIR